MRVECGNVDLESWFLNTIQIYYYTELMILNTYIRDTFETTGIFLIEVKINDEGKVERKNVERSRYAT